jgi:hypothetical protein
LTFIKEDFSGLLPKYLALYKDVQAPKDYTGKICRAVETARRRCGLKKFERRILKEKQTKLKVWADGLEIKKAVGNM